MGKGLVNAPGVAMTDTDFPSILILNLASNADLGQRMETVLFPDRWRGNIWLDGLEPWEECGWVGRELQIGETVLKVQEVITRCKATTLNPETGIRDADTLAALRGAFGQQGFGLYATVLTGGEIRLGHRVEVHA